MNDLRHDPDAPDAATHARLRPHAPNGTPPVPHARIDPDELRTVTMPDLRTPEARLLDAAQRGLDGTGHKDVRTFDQVVIAELVRLVDAMQGLSLRQDVFEEELGARRGVVDARLARLEESVKRIADSIQIMALERDGRGRG